MDATGSAGVIDELREALDEDADDAVSILCEMFQAMPLGSFGREQGERALRVIGQLALAGKLKATAVTSEAELLDRHGKEKDEAIGRLRASNAASSVTAAKEMVATDEGYAEYLSECRAATATRYKAEAVYDCAKQSAALALKLVPTHE